MLRFYVRNMLLSPAMLVAAIGLYLSMVVSIWPFDVCDLVYNYQYTISLGFTGFFIPVASVLPTCYFQHVLSSGKTIQFCLLRSQKKSYVSVTCFSTMLSGAVVMVVAFLLFTITCLLYSSIEPLHWGYFLFAYNSTFYEPLTSQPWFLYLILGGIFALNGVMWPMISLFCFSLTPNQYLATALPFIIRTAMGYFAQPMGLYALDPAQLLLKGVAVQWVGGGIPYLLLYTGIVAAVFGGIWILREYRRFHNG